jgi:hypothetical protein
MNFRRAVRAIFRCAALKQLGNGSHQSVEDPIDGHNGSSQVTLVFFYWFLFSFFGFPLVLHTRLLLFTVRLCPYI